MPTSSVNRIIMEEQCWEMEDILFNSMMVVTHILYSWKIEEGIEEESWIISFVESSIISYFYDMLEKGQKVKPNEQR